MGIILQIALPIITLIIASVLLRVLFRSLWNMAPEELKSEILMKALEYRKKAKEKLLLVKK